MFSITVEYAVRSLIELARQPAGEALLGRDLAERAGVAKDYLAKILGTLRNAGIVSSVPGIGGGYRLAKAPETIRLLDLVLLFDGESSLPRCVLSRARPCSSDHSCSAHALWRDVREGYVAFLERATIAEVSRTAQAVPSAPSATPTAPLNPTATRTNPR